jgi:hypothetical protein
MYASLIPGLGPYDAFMFGLALPVQTAATPTLAVSPSTASAVDESTPISITATLTESTAALTASLSGDGTLSTTTPISGTPFTYTPPAEGTSTAVVTVTDSTDNLSQTCTITFAPEGGIVIGLTLSDSFLSGPQARSANYTIKITSDLSLTGQTVQLVTVSPQGVRQVESVTVSSDGTYALLTTTATTFTSSGTYSCELQIVNEDSTTTNAAVVDVPVAASL